ncbi:dehydratase [Candidatus Accumulibacter vicinus]|uniref:(3R)-hydroxymyristoyl-ACP dehydratase n=1 Tax=Candidatus Accumulibacter vicinus TaxID=2954382 RepID=A0A084Y3L7_9PROT|nr:dehydratase [Candidatus Accumulibacter vicinus]KFB69311.1 MAG: (3R)-hydroxymyristoyl-ACP dehydratase [Candidatus Accumulibacter vicinus]
MRRADFEWIVAAGHPAFSGHFPGRPIVPGVVLLDRALHFAETLLGRPAVAWEIAQTKFFSPVGPGQALTFQLHERPDASIAFSVLADGREVAAGHLKPGR